MGRNQTEKKSNEKSPRKETRMKVGRYHKYTPLNVSLANLYKEIGQVERFPKPKALKIKDITNRSLFYIITVSSIRRRIGEVHHLIEKP